MEQGVSVDRVLGCAESEQHHSCLFTPPPPQSVETRPLAACRRLLCSCKLPLYGSIGRRDHNSLYSCLHYCMKDIEGRRHFARHQYQNIRTMLFYNNINGHGYYCINYLNDSCTHLRKARRYLLEVVHRWTDVVVAQKERME